MVSPGESEKEPNKDEILPGFKTIEEFTQGGFKAVIEATKFTNKLPSGHSWDLYNARPSFQKIMDNEGNKILQMMNMILGHQGIKGNIVMRDMEEKFDLVVDFNDTILERVGSNLDDISGIRRNPEPFLVESSGSTTRVVSGSWNRNTSIVSPNLKKVPMRLLTARNIERPQIKFKDKIDNSLSPFEPRIKEKPNSLKPLSILLELSEAGECFSHPYEYELDLFKPPENQLQKVVPIMYKNINETPLVMVNTAKDVEDMMVDLKKFSEIAVDLEHHSYRTFQGITCLMQISTRDKDYIIDTLELRDKLYVLNEVFTDPKVVKVFHGSASDVEWLQRDLSLYVVNMFDTHQAARMLNFSHLSLAYLLKHYCNISVNKQFQLADWRMRPLPEELISYAREDTHYLLYVYDVMKNALIEAANNENKYLLTVLEQSKELCKRRYEKPILSDDSHLELYRKNKKMFDNRQMYAFRELFRWRDKTARDEDESTGYVLPNHMLMSIAEVLPREMQGILALCSPIPPLLRQNVLKLHHIILKAREQSLTRPVMEAEARMRPIAQTVWNKIDLDSPLYCPHDMKYKQDFREDLPTVINSLGQNLINEEISHKLLNSKPKISLFEEDEEEEGSNEGDSSASCRTQRSLFVSPYERYRKARPFIEAQEKDKEEELRKQKEAATAENDRVPQPGTPSTQKSPEQELAVPFIQQPGKRKRVKEDADDSTPRLKIKKKKNDQNPHPSTSSAIAPVKRKSQNEDSSSPPKKKRVKEDADDSTSGLKIKQKKKDQNPHPSTSSAITSVKQNDQNEDSSSPPKKKKGNKKKQLLGKQNSDNQPKEFQSFDYSQVDFSKFQGGSKKVTPKQQKNKGKLKPKGKKTKFIGKTNHKSMTFGMNGR